jgi:NAD(P)-dependent dehydrogenase (short-subunit alcohol dehydrogenase family)
VAPVHPSIQLRVSDLEGNGVRRFMRRYSCRTGDPAKAGRRSVLLLSDELSSFATGTYLIVDGGLHLYSLAIYADEISAMNNS